MVSFCDLKKAKPKGANELVKRRRHVSRRLLEPLVEHEVDQDAGDGDIEPEGEGPAGPGAVALEAAFQGVGHCDEDQRDDGDRQHDVGEKHPVVKSAPGAFAAEGCVDSLDEEFVEDIGGEENAGDEKRPEHAEAVGDFAFAFDANETGEEEEGGDAVESGIEGRQIRDAHCGEFWRSSFRQVSTM